MNSRNVFITDDYFIQDDYNYGRATDSDTIKELIQKLGKNSLLQSAVDNNKGLKEIFLFGQTLVILNMDAIMYQGYLFMIDLKGNKSNVDLVWEHFLQGKGFDRNNFIKSAEGAISNYETNNVIQITGKYINGDSVE